MTSSTHLHPPESISITSSPVSRGPRLSPPSVGHLSPDIEGLSTSAVENADGTGSHTARRERPTTSVDDLAALSCRCAAVSTAQRPQGIHSDVGNQKAGLDVRGHDTVGNGFVAAGESLGWLRNESHQQRLRQLREKYGYDDRS